MKFSMYNLPVEVEEGITLYNSRNAGYVNIFKEPELSHFRNLLLQDKLDLKDEMVRKLYDYGYVVKDDCDEYLEVFNEIKDIYEDSEKVLSLLIYVTEKCNFRCVYCPQTHEPKVFSDENWESLYKHVQKNVANGKYRALTIRFFGGEPLLEVNKIFEFCEKIENLKKEYPNFYYRYDMVTNAYLLTPKIYDKLTSYKFDAYQITVDGFAETHDKMRVRADGAPTWDQIIKNLEYINTKQDEVSISLRINCNKENYSTISDFVSWAKGHFDNSKFKFTIEPVAKFSEQVDDCQLGEQTHHELQKILRGDERLQSKPKYYLMRLGKACHCANRSYFCVTVDGKLAKCDQSYNSEYVFVGHIDSNGDFIFNSNYSVWSEDYEIEKCKTCLIYPLCAARACPRSKVRSGNGARLDCVANDKDVRQEIIDIIQDGFLEYK